MSKEDDTLVIDRGRYSSEMTPKPCCCCLDVRMGTVLIGLFNLIVHSASLVIAAQMMVHPSMYKYGYSDGHRIAGDNFVGMTLACFSFLITVMLIYGALMRKPGLILPFFAVQVVEVVLFVLGAAGAISYGHETKFKLENCASFRYSKNVREMSLYTFMFVLITACLIILMIKVYLMACVWECYQFVKRQLERPASFTFYPTMDDDEVPLPKYEDAIKLPKETPPPYY